MNFGAIKKELRDQSAHIVAGNLALFPLAIFGINPVTLGWATFCMGMVREVGEEGKPVTIAKVWKALGSKRDLSFWTLGGVLLGIGVWAVHWLTQTWWAS